MHILKSIKIALLLVVISVKSYSQQQYLPINKDVNYLYENYIYNQTQSFHTSIKPYIYSEVLVVDSIDKTLIIKKNSLLINYLLNNNLYKFEKKSFILQINPIFSYIFHKDFMCKNNCFCSNYGLSINADFL